MYARVSITGTDILCECDDARQNAVSLPSSIDGFRYALLILRGLLFIRLQQVDNSASGYALSIENFKASFPVNHF